MVSIRRVTRGAKRIDEIIRTLAKYGLAHWLGHSLPDWVQRHLKTAGGTQLSELTTPQRVRMALTELGPTFIKIGQVLSTRSDMVGPELADELAHLQNETPADSAETIRSLVESELDTSIEDVFSEFDGVAFASASIGQVHAAKLPDGTEVVVKVQHPDVERSIVSDLDLLARLADLTQAHSSELRLYRPRALVDQLRRQLLQELDFGRELRNIERFRRNFDDDPTVTFPRPVPELSSRRVLTMERIHGSSIRKVEQVRASGADPTEVAQRGANLYLEMIFRDGFYHADPHPGNVWILPTGTLCLLDCGMVGSLDEHLRGEIEGLILAATRRDSARMADHVINFGSVPRNLDRDALEADMAEFVDEYGDRALASWNFADVFRDLMAVVRRHRIVLPQRVALLLRALVVLEGTGRSLNPEFSLGELLEPHAHRALGRSLSPRRIQRKLSRGFRDWDRLLQVLPRELTQVLLGLREGSFDVHLQHRRLDAVANRLIYGILCAALLLGGSTLWSQQVSPVVGGTSLPALGMLLMAAWIGWRLVAAIERFGGLGRKKR